MKKHQSAEQPHLPISPNELFQRLKDFVGSYRTLKKITGVEISTLESWCISAPLDQVRTLLRLLSAIPESQRHALIDSATLSLPRLDHRFLTGDKMILARLGKIAVIEKGITVVASESDYLRTFLVTAILNSAVGLKRCIFGYDVHCPDWFVPVEGVHYLSVAGNHLRLREATQVRLHIPSGTQIVFLNGLWSFYDDQRKVEIIRSAQNCHLVICDRPKSINRLTTKGINYIITAVRNPLLPIGADDAEHMRIAIQEFE